MNEDGSINVEKVLENSKDLTVEKLNEYVKSCEKKGMLIFQLSWFVIRKILANVILFDCSLFFFQRWIQRSVP